MQVILTHEQADFDAVGAMLAAYLLSSQYKPLLPNKINRNVRKFLNLYGFDLPFLEYRDLPAEAIQCITLVDTQSLITLKGMSKKTLVHVVDHHQESADLPVEWTHTIEKTGATTTILVEQMQKGVSQLSMVQATLLLLAIYEDTGSLTYASTTVRDVKAAAFLLEMGANLQITADFLNPALSPEQKILADRLMESAQSINIQGKNILVAAADGSTISDEISSIAHKLRDLFDPDALFLLVKTSEGIRVVARSTTDAVDVGKVTLAFGGGGHTRAAAALIHNNDPHALAKTSEKLVAELNRVILPSLTVGKIMSKRPLLISPETSLAEAESLMRKYGYEGFPVVADGVTIGLLTRRAVDRAVNHKLDLSAGSLMEAGNFSVTPDQTLDQLQTLMATTGWGQIPVVDPVTSKIVGIVTRTDLLKNLTGQEKKIASPVNYAKMLETALSKPRLALLKKIVEVAALDRQALYIVGGFVRDLILELPSKDFDIVVEGDALRLAHALAAIYGGRVVSHRRFGTAKWQTKEIRKVLAQKLEIAPNEESELPDALDLISARTEFYDHPTALPTVEHSSIKLDLHRRDFTINTLALRLDGRHYGELHDYWGGLVDLQNKRVKVLHSLSFVDDPTRLLRAVRFEQRFDFTIEARTLELIAEARPMLKQLSGDRIRHELDQMLDEKKPAKLLDRLSELNLLTAIHPSLNWTPEIARSFKKIFPLEGVSTWELPKSVGSLPIHKVLAYLVWFGHFEPEAAEVICRRLRFPTTLTQAVKGCSVLYEDHSNLKLLPTSKLAERLRPYPSYVLFAIHNMVEDAELREKLHQYVTQWRFIEPKVDGETLRTMGVPPGPVYGTILNELRSAWLDKMITNEKEETQFLLKLIQTSQESPSDERKLSNS